MTQHQPLTVGSRAPMFTLKDAKGNTVSLRELIATKPVLLFFYPGDMTPGCTMQLCAIRDEWEAFKKADVHIFGVNHANAQSHTAFSDAYHFPFHLLIDEGKKVSTQYGAIRKFFKTLIIKRTVVGIAKDGTIFYYKAGMPKNADILKALPKK
ncbi:MAG: peroxiredoxin [Candidatus Uhrbacteria bacterium]|nr:peroxiredoxin [Candidatus Uhrbacteria bacterium]